MADPATKKMMVDGIGMIAVTDEAEVAISTLLRRLVDSASTLATANAAVSAKDGEIAALKVKVTEGEAALTAAKDAAPKGAALDALVTARTALFTDANRIHGDRLVGDNKADHEIRLQAVTKKLGDAGVKDKDEAFIAASFATLAATHPAPAAGGGSTADTIAAAVAQGIRTPSGDKAMTYEERMRARQAERTSSKKGS